MANRIRLEPGRYRSETPVVLSTMHNGRELEYRTVGAGSEFDVPPYVNNFWAAATYFPDDGDAPPRYRRIDPAEPAPAACRVWTRTVPAGKVREGDLFVEPGGDELVRAERIETRSKGRSPAVTDVLIWSNRGGLWYGADAPVEVAYFPAGKEAI